MPERTPRNHPVLDDRIKSRSDLPWKTPPNCRLWSSSRQQSRFWLECHGQVSCTSGRGDHGRVGSELLAALPVDLTFVDAEDRVCYFTPGKDRIFDRSVAMLGRKVENCHPPKSVHFVRQIVADFRFILGKRT